MLCYGECQVGQHSMSCLGRRAGADRSQVGFLSSVMMMQNLQEWSLSMIVDVKELGFCTQLRETLVPGIW